MSVPNAEMSLGRVSCTVGFSSCGWLDGKLRLVGCSADLNYSDET